MPFAQYARSNSTKQQQPYDVSMVNRQIDNATKRIQDAGFTPQDADTRNWFEKLTNLPEHQNAFLDTLELLGRPGQGIMNIIDKVPTGQESAGQAFLRGISGQERIHGADIIEHRGIDNPLTQAILGTGLEIATDPLNLVPAGAIAKGVTAVAKPVVRGFARFAKTIEPEAVRALRENTIQPALSQAKDAIGRAVIPDYKLNETLYGTTDDTIKNLRQQTENNIGFQTEEALRNVSDAAKLAGGVETGADVGRILEAPLKNFEENGIEIPRPQRELSANPGIHQAAGTLLRSNQAVRQMALDNGVGINEIEGYMTHILSQEERNRRNNLVAINRGNRGIGQPKKAILNPRKLVGSVEDINEQVGRNFFEPNAFFATAIGQKRLIEYANAVNFRRQVLANHDFAIPYEKGMDIPKNAVVIDSNNYKFLKDPEETLPENIGGQYLVTKSVKTALDRYQKLTTDEGINDFLKVFDRAQSAWKRLALFSVPFHLRNDIGAKFNNWVGGMPLHAIAKYSAQADKEVYNAIIKGQESALYNEYRKQGLSDSSLSGIEYARGGMEPEEAIKRTIEKRSQYDGTLKGRLKAEAKQLKNPLNAFETSREFGQFIDQTNRFALYKWARDKGKSPEEAAKLVRTVQFDYRNTTPLEREVFARVIPFYRWMRNNIPFQIRSFINDPKKYANINKLRLNAQDATGINDENVPDFMKESFSFPVTGQGGKGQFLGLNLPLSDLTKLSQPLKTAIDSVTPIAKLPAEVEQNRNFFFQSPIKRFAGQEKQFQVPFGGPKFGVDQTLAYILEQLGGQVGRGVSGFFQQPQNQDQELQFLKPALGISSLLKPYDAQKSEYFQQRDKLQQLQDLLNYIEQQTGQRPRTVQEIQRSG
jgi:hypothetical protein